jgi:hypothetical protein
MNNFLKIAKSLNALPTGQGICPTLINPKYVSWVYSTVNTNITIHLNGGVNAGVDRITVTLQTGGTLQRDAFINAVIEASSSTTSNASSVSTLDFLPSTTYTYVLA